MFDENTVYSFPPISNTNAHTLILGSMPGVASLHKGQYYAHPRNAFWPLMLNIFDVKIDLDYAARQSFLIEHGIAVWDVLKCCQRAGSLDSNIKQDSMIVNDFASFFDTHHDVSRVFFNGGTAETVFKKYVLPQLTVNSLFFQRMPSTSPAHASLSFAEKLILWKQAILPIPT